MPKVDQHNTGSPVYERIERVIVERAPQSAPASIPDENIYEESPTEVVREMPRQHWSPDWSASRLGITRTRCAGAAGMT